VGVVFGGDDLLPGRHTQIEKGKHRQTNVRITLKKFFADLDEAGYVKTAGVPRDDEKMAQSLPVKIRN
jgi:hypothetical protein